MSTFEIYYLETNLICMMFMAFVTFSYARESRGLEEAKYFIMSTLGVQLYCVSDICAALFKNDTFAGARTILWTANTVYITVPLVLAIIWQRYSIIHMSRYRTSDRKFVVVNKVAVYAAIVLCILSLSSPVTHFSFYLDDMNGYHRSIGAYVVPFLAYAFLIIELIRARYIARESNDLEAETEAKVMSLLPLPCVLFSLLQLVFYGITTAQVGFTMGYMIVHLARQRKSISRDELTGLNNRRQFEFAIDRLTRSTGDALVAMIDVDSFKKINDTFGHAEGDAMLRAVAETLYKACNRDEIAGEYTLYRYGGDEFVILSSSSEALGEVATLGKCIEEEVAKTNETKHLKTKMSLSTGFAGNKLIDEDIRRLIQRADNEMYHVKHEKKVGR